MLRFFQWRVGRYKLAALVLKTRPCRKAGVGAIPTLSAIYNMKQVILDDADALTRVAFINLMKTAFSKGDLVRFELSEKHAKDLLSWAKQTPSALVKESCHLFHGADDLLVHPGDKTVISVEV